jgi:hypothetical protein
VHGAEGKGKRPEQGTEPEGETTGGIEGVTLVRKAFERMGNGTLW